MQKNRPEIKVQMKRQKWSNTSAYDEEKRSL